MVDLTYGTGSAESLGNVDSPISISPSWMLDIPSSCQRLVSDDVFHLKVFMILSARCGFPFSLLRIHHLASSSGLKLTRFPFLLGS